ncbi:glycosyltransferase WbsX family protein [Arcicella lustrica]|uniref:Glycoside hydrolase family 99-like domain-containing protein n=1 Tax=Arcicella lustrica TaxID=2984196 RepID=A0ABU5SMQ3_9BACT|nr:glycoside hydrolase family 99-like domain-containing protein [Arcicella sp. DC25W]MEA5428593.1 glycoside hydrolase family 99-like domain-containing protein [Arcicella sp. DC25W]
MKEIKGIAIYLPQYHPIKENDKWWGNGFTEWRNVVKGKVIIKGQYQPHLPLDLGYYDLRLPEIREAQAELAKNSSIHGFCYYHYWFKGKRLLDLPINNVLESKKPDFPFCLCWANENWSRNWDGRSKNMLLEQAYNEEDDLAHIQFLCKEVFTDSRYIKVDGKPLFVVYRPELFPDFKKTANIWRNEAKKLGFPDLYLGFFWTFESNIHPDKFGLDFAAQFPPNKYEIKRKISLLGRVLVKLGMGITLRQKYQIYEYKQLVKYSENFEYNKDFTLFPGITPMWDNYVRRRNGGGRIFLNSTPELYKKWLNDICKRWNPKSSSENFLFINAWNEWAEGNHLEPCEKWGHQYLDATREVLSKYKSNE